jgi:hypothetical protein
VPEEGRRALEKIAVQIPAALGLPDDEAKHLERLGFKLAEAVKSLGLFLKEVGHRRFL